MVNSHTLHTNEFSNPRNYHKHVKFIWFVLIMCSIIIVIGSFCAPSQCSGHAQNSHRIPKCHTLLRWPVINSLKCFFPFFETHCSESNVNNQQKSCAISFRSLLWSYSVGSENTKLVVPFIYNGIQKSIDKVVWNIF